MAARYFTMEEVLDRVVNDDNVSEKNGDSSKSETEFMENSNGSGKFEYVLYIWNETSSIYKQCHFVFILSYGNIYFVNIQMMAMATVIVVLSPLEVNVVEQEVCLEDEDCTGEEVLEELAVVLGIVDKKTEGN